MKGELEHLNPQEIDNSLTSKTLLKVLNISQTFDYPLFHNISFDLKEKESIAIIGMSGSGKSTLLNIISSLLQPDEGEIYYQDRNIYTISNKQLDLLRREDFGIIFQSHYLFRGFNVEENLLIAQLLANKNDNQDLTKTLKIDHILKQGIGEISGGQQQRVSIARVLNKKPRIIFADEPTGNLDTKTANDVMDVMFDYTIKEKAGIILVTHEEFLANRCNKVYKLEDTQLKRIK